MSQKQEKRMRRSLPEVEQRLQDVNHRITELQVELRRAERRQRRLPKNAGTNRWHRFLILAYLLWAVVVFAVIGHALFLRQTQAAAMAAQDPEPLQVLVLDAAPPEEPEPEPLNLEALPCIENATMTHYCTCKRCCGKEETHPAYGITASGRAAEPYVSVAVDPILIPLGSIVYVDYGDGNLQTYRADDTGSGVAGAHIDLCVSSHEEALELGVKTVKVYWEESK